MSGNANYLINLKQIDRGKDLLHLLQYGLSSNKVTTDIIIPTKVTEESITQLTGGGAIQLANTGIVVDALHRMEIIADGDRVKQELYTVANDTGLITPVGDFAFEVDEPHSLLVTYHYVGVDNTDKYTVTQIIELIKVALNDTSAFEDELSKLSEKVATEISSIKQKSIKDRVKLTLTVTTEKESVDSENIVSKPVVNNTPEQPILDKLDLDKEYLIFDVDNRPIVDINGLFITYNPQNKTLSGVVGKLVVDGEQDVPKYEPNLGEIQAKLFPIGTFTFEELPEDYLLDNDEFVASSYQLAIDQIITDLAKNQKLLETLSELISQELQTEIEDLKTTIYGENGGTGDDKGLVGKIEKVEQADIFVCEEPILEAHGGVKVGQSFAAGISHNDLLMKILYPYKSVVTAITANDTSGNAKLREIGETVTLSAVTGTATKKTNAIKDAYFTVLGTKVQCEEITGKTQTFTLADAGTYTIDANTPNKVIRFTAVTANEDNNGDDTKYSDVSYSFINPAYIGTVAKGTEITSDVIKGLTKKLQNPANINQKFTGVEVQMVFACPPGWTVKTIIDQNNFDITASFTSKTVSVTCLDGTERDYTVYVSGATTVDAFGVNFNR